MRLWNHAVKVADLDAESPGCVKLAFPLSWSRRKSSQNLGVGE